MAEDIDEQQVSIRSHRNDITTGGGTKLEDDCGDDDDDNVYAIAYVKSML